MHIAQHFYAQVFSLGLWLAILAAIFVPLERLCAVEPRDVRLSETFADLGYYFLSSLLPAVLLAAPSALLAAAIARCVPAAVGAWVATWPVAARVVGAVLASELGAYAGHRLSHRVPLLWRFHAVHHAPTQMHWLVHTRSHPVDMVFVRLCGLVPVFALGLAKPTGVGATVAVIATLAATVWGFLIHADVRLRFGWLEHVVATPIFHHWHHTRSGPLDRNFAAMFPFIDRLFGTLHVSADWPARYGTDTPVPRGFVAQLLWPWHAEPEMRSSFASRVFDPRVRARTRLLRPIENERSRADWETRYPS